LSLISIDRQDQIKIYKWTQKNDYILWATNREIGMGGGGCGFAFTLYDDMSHGQSAATETFGNPSLYDPNEDEGDAQDPIRLILNVLSPVQEGSVTSESVESYHDPLEAPNTVLPPTLKTELLPPTEDDSSLPDQVQSFRTLSLKSQSPFKVSRVQIYGFSSELRNRKKPKLARLWGNRPSDVRPSK
jgi:hypothetical protein